MDAVNYKNGQKNQWRRTAWNEIAKHVRDKRDAIVLYLPGSTDLDRAEAVRRGFKPANLIAIERDPEVARMLRQRGVTTVIGTLNEVVASWPASRKIAVLIADMQCGYTQDVRLLSILCKVHPALEGACLMFNLQRGRDPLFQAEVRGRIISIDEAVAKTDSIGPDDLGARAEDWPDGFWEERKRRHVEAVREEFEMSFPWFSKLNRAIGVAMDFQGHDVSVRQLPPYRSTPSSPYFDSVVVALSRSESWRAGVWAGRAASSWLPPLETKGGEVAAALAIRTRRLRGELGGARC